jgi:hypothetical protein
MGLQTTRCASGTALLGVQVQRCAKVTTQVASHEAEIW